MQRTAVVILWCILVIPLVGAPYLARADSTKDLAITPVVIDVTGKDRDILKESFTITNTSNRNLNLYPTVNNIDPAAGKQGFGPALNSTDLKDSLANWIELSRGVINIMPGEERTIDFVIRINYNAVPGDYHALISFGDGITRAAAGQKDALASLTVNLTVDPDIKELLQLNKFTSDNIVFNGDDVLFNYQLQNIGNQDLQPSGEIRIFDVRGQEVASLDVNRDGRSIAPDQTAQLASVWSAVQGFGKYKALLTVNYGKGQEASVVDSTYFWIIPWKQLVFFISGLLIVVIFLALYFHRWIEERHFGKLAQAGLLKAEAVMHIHPHEHNPVPTTPTPPSESRIRSILSRVMSIVRREKTPDITFPATPSRPRGPEHVKSVYEPTPAEAPLRHVNMGGTIDLKRMRRAPKAPVQEAPAQTPPQTEQEAPVPPPVKLRAEVQGGVINLKKPR